MYPDDFCGEVATWYENGGYTANDVCVACGGGRNPNADEPEATTPPSVFNNDNDDPDETEATTPPSVVINGRIDFPQDWMDSFGDGCDWYSESNCAQYGDTFPNQEGLTANDACAVCGGGRVAGEEADTDDANPNEVDADETTPPSVVNNDNDGPDETEATTPPTVVVDGRIDFPTGWMDAYGDGCDWYAADSSRCPLYGKNFADHEGLTANDVCAVCGGGRDAAAVDTDADGTETSTTPPSFDDTEFSTTPPSLINIGRIDYPIGWTDSCGDGCDWYSEHPDNCATYGDMWANQEGLTANDACAVCGGGLDAADVPDDTEPPTTDMPFATPPPFAVDGRVNFPADWTDSWGDTCDWYSREAHRCGEFGDRFANQEGQTANMACAACGGGRAADGVP